MGQAERVQAHMTAIKQRLYSLLKGSWSKMFSL
jgi:hypothetical protein